MECVCDEDPSSDERPLNHEQGSISMLISLFDDVLDVSSVIQPDMHIEDTTRMTKIFFTFTPLNFLDINITNFSVDEGEL